MSKRYAHIDVRMSVDEDEAKLEALLVEKGAAQVTEDRWGSARMATLHATGPATGIRGTLATLADEIQAVLDDWGLGQ